MLMLPKSWLDRWQGLDIFDQLFEIEGDVYREHEGRKTLRFSIDNKNHFAKLHRGVGWKEIIKNLLQLRLPVTSAKNEWRAIKRVGQLGINTMRLVGFGKRGLNPARIQSFVITEELANTVSLEDFSRNWPERPPDYALKRALIMEVARIARTLHENGLNHRDLYICHFLLDISEGSNRVNPTQPVIFLIDLHRVQIRKYTPRRWRVKDIAGLYFSSMDIGLTKRDLLRFIRVYTNKPLKALLHEDRSFWQQVTNQCISVYRRNLNKSPTLPW